MYFATSSGQLLSPAGIFAYFAPDFGSGNFDVDSVRNVDLDWSGRGETCDVTPSKVNYPSRISSVTCVHGRSRNPAASPRCDLSSSRTFPHSRQVVMSFHESAPITKNISASGSGLQTRQGFNRVRPFGHLDLHFRDGQFLPRHSWRDTALRNGGSRCRQASRLCGA